MDVFFAGDSVKSPLCSAVITSYCRDELLKRAVESVWSQTVSKKPGILELIVVDDGGAPHRFHRFCDWVNRQRPPCATTCLRPRHNGGVSQARNIGVQWASGKWVSFLDSDDEWHPRKIQIQMQQVLDSGRRWCHGQEIWIRKGVRVNPKKKHDNQGTNLFCRSTELCLVSPSTVMLERSLLQEKGCFDGRFEVCEDFDLWLRILRNVPIEHCLHRVTTKYGGHHDQLSSRARGDYFRIMSLLRLLSSDSLESEQRACVQRSLRKKAKIYLQGLKKHNRLKELSLLKESISPNVGDVYGPSS